jgi:phosphonate transport system substrate-binding protein
MSAHFSTVASFVRAIVVVLVISAAFAGGAYYEFVTKPIEENQQIAQQVAATVVGLRDTQAVHKLSPEYTDSTGSMVADTPTDAAQLINPDTLVFSWIPEGRNEQDRTDFADLMKRIADATGKKVVYDMDLEDTNQQISAMHDGKLHIAIFSTGAVQAAVNTAGFVPIGMMASESGNAKHQMLIIVPANSPIRAPEDLAGKELALTDPSSNSGYQAPIVLLRNDDNLVLQRDYRIRTTGGYDQSIADLIKGECDAAAVSSDVLARDVAEGRIKMGDFRVIKTSEDLPSAAIGYAHNLNPDLAAKIKAAILAFDFKGTSLESRFASSNQARFVPVDYRNDWALVRMIENSIGRQ